MPNTIPNTDITPNPDTTTETATTTNLDIIMMSITHRRARLPATKLTTTLLQDIANQFTRRKIITATIHHTTASTLPPTRLIVMLSGENTDRNHMHHLADMVAAAPQRIMAGHTITNIMLMLTIIHITPEVHTMVHQHTKRTNSKQKKEQNMVILTVLTQQQHTKLQSTLNTPPMAPAHLHMTNSHHQALQQSSFHSHQGSAVITNQTTGKSDLPSEKLVMPLTLDTPTLSMLSLFVWVTMNVVNVNTKP